jgi:hypothetical protein
MSPKQVLERFIDLFNHANAKAITELYDENAVNHQTEAGGIADRINISDKISLLCLRRFMQCGSRAIN